MNRLTVTVSRRALNYDYPPPSMSASSPDQSRAGQLRARLGGVLWVFAPFQFVAGMAVAQLGWSGRYSVLANSISDLGAVGCGNWSSGTTRYVCSPWHDVFNVSAIIFGLMLLAGAVLVAREFPPSRASHGGIALVAVGGAGSIGVGLFPQDVNLAVHSISAVLALVGGNFALLILGYSMVRRPRWRLYETISITCGVVGLAAFAWFLSGLWGPLGLGGTERLAEGSRLLWALLAGLHMFRARS